jgi:hypothetical protein
MLAQLASKPLSSALEPLAQAAPADFYFLRVRDFSTFLDLSELADSWGTPALDMLDGRSSDRDLRARYETELGLQDSELSHSFGPSVVEQLAVVGSDPYLVEGSDLTLIFKVKSGLLFDAALLKALDAFTVAHPGLDTQRFVHEGEEVTVTRSRDGRVRRHRASVSGLDARGQKLRLRSGWRTRPSARFRSLAGVARATGAWFTRRERRRKAGIAAQRGLLR